MDDTISRQAAIDALLEEVRLVDGHYVENDEVINKDDAVDALKRLPYAQPDIIACGDCKHWICHDRKCGYWNHGVKPLDWCSYAERREQE